MFESKILKKATIVFTVLITLLSILIYSLTVLGFNQPAPKVEPSRATINKVVTLVNHFKISKPTDPRSELIKKKEQLLKPENIDKLLINRAQAFQDHLQKLYKENKNQLSKKQLKKKIANFIKTHRYGKEDDGYYFVYDFNSRIILHPIKPSIEGISLKKVKDANGVYYINAMVKTAKKDENGTVIYQWKNPSTNKVETKYAYVFHFQPYNWVVGTAEYESQLNEEIQDTLLEMMQTLSKTPTFEDSQDTQKFITKLKSLTSKISIKQPPSEQPPQIVNISTIVLLVVLVFLFIVIATLFLKKFLEPIVSLSKQASLVTAGDYDAKLTHYSDDEIGNLCHEFNIIVSTLKKNLSKSSTKTQDDTTPIEESTASMKGKKLLLVEDNSINQGIISEVLKQSGVFLDIANNGKEALDMFEKNQNYDLILMDIQMPVMDGYEATKEIRKTDKDIPIIALSANTKPEDITNTKAVGMDDYLKKPIDVERLYEIILQYVSKNSSVASTQLPHFESIDTKEGLKHLAGNESVYLKLLNNFKNDFKDIDLHILNDEDLKIFSHTLKGLSGNIGAKNLYLITKKLDETLDRNLFEAFYKELHIVITELNEKLQIQEDTSTSKKPVTPQIKEELFAKLKESIELMEPSKCRLVIEEIEGYQLSNKDYATFIKVRDFIDEYEFDEALELL